MICAIGTKTGVVMIWDHAVGASCSVGALYYHDLDNSMTTGTHTIMTSITVGRGFERLFTRGGGSSGSIHVPAYFIWLLYDPENMRLMIIGSWVDDRKAVRVRYSTSGSVYLFSKPLIIGIRQVSNILTSNASYLVEGEAREKERYLLFPLKDAEITSEDGHGIVMRRCLCFMYQQG